MTMPILILGYMAKASKVKMFGHVMENDSYDCHK